MNPESERRVNEIVKQLEHAWNTADGESFGRPFAEDADFVNIRGLHIRSRKVIGEGHQHIFNSIYKGSSVVCELSSLRPLAPGVLLAHVKSTLNAPAGPLAGVHTAVFSMVMVEARNEWRIAAFHNTLVAP